MKNWNLLSHTLNLATPGYGGHAGFQREVVSCIDHGKSSNSERWQLSNHIGTHIDCPYHFSNLGKKLTDYQEADWVFLSPFLVTIQAQENQLISIEDLNTTIPKECDFLLIKTGFEYYRKEKVYWNNNPGLSPELGKWLRINRPTIKVVGFDFISLTAYQHRDIGKLSHQIFLTPDKSHDGIRIIEDMKLSVISTSPQRIIASPLLVEDADGAPVMVWAQ